MLVCTCVFGGCSENSTRVCSGACSTWIYHFLSCGEGRLWLPNGQGVEDRYIIWRPRDRHVSVFFSSSTRLFHMFREVKHEVAT